MKVSPCRMNGRQTVCQTDYPLGQQHHTWNEKSSHHVAAIQRNDYISGCHITRWTYSSCSIVSTNDNNVQLIRQTINILRFDFDPPTPCHHRITTTPRHCINQQVTFPFTWSVDRVGVFHHQSFLSAVNSFIQCSNEFTPSISTYTTLH